MGETDTRSQSCEEGFWHHDQNELFLAVNADEEKEEAEEEDETKEVAELLVRRHDHDDRSRLKIWHLQK